MKYSELPAKLESWILGKVIEHEDGSISVDGTVNWSGENLPQLPIQFKEVTGNFDCSSNNLTSLIGAPRTVGGEFRCNYNKLTSLEFAPKSVGRSFICIKNRLTSLDGLGEVRGEIICGDNPVSEEELIADYRRKRAKKDLASESLAVEKLLN